MTDQDFARIVKLAAHFATASHEAEILSDDPERDMLNLPIDPEAIDTLLSLNPTIRRPAFMLAAAIVLHSDPLAMHDAPAEAEDAERRLQEFIAQNGQKTL